MYHFQSFVFVITMKALVSFQGSLHAAAINTIPLEMEGKQFIATPLSSDFSTGQSNSSNVQQLKDPQLSASMIEALQVAKNYVDLLDKNQFAQSWLSGDPIFQKTVSQNEWIKALELARQRLGRVKTRTLKDQKPGFDPKGLPAGSYMVVEFNTSFDRAAQSGELLTLRLDPDGIWRVLTYQVN